MSGSQHFLSALTRPRAVLLDLDNTLYEYLPCHDAALDEVAKRFAQKYRVSDDRFREVWESSRTAVKQRLGATASSHSRLLYLKQCLNNLGLGSELQSALEFDRYYWIQFLRHITLATGVTEFLRTAQVFGLPCVIVTDYSAGIQLQKILALGIENHLDGMITSEEAGGDKLTGLPYRLATEQLGLDGPEVWMIGDDPVADIEKSREFIGATPIQRLHPVLPFGNQARRTASAAGVFTKFESLTASLTRLMMTPSEDLS